MTGNMAEDRREMREIDSRPWEGSEDGGRGPRLKPDRKGVQEMVRSLEWPPYHRLCLSLTPVLRDQCSVWASGSSSCRKSFPFLAVLNHGPSIDMYKSQP